MVKRSILTAVLVFCGQLLFAGDVANFINLGFSIDSKYFMFGEYGMTENSVAYASISAVEVARDKFASDGVRSGQYRGVFQAGQDGLGALLNLLSDNAAFSKRFRIDHLLTGRELYLLVDGQEPKPSLEFRDFQTGNSFVVTLNQSQSQDGDVSASFSIDVTIQAQAGKPQHYSVGLPNFKRPGVENYRIRRIVLSPDNRSLVFVIERQEKDQNGANVRFMVDTLVIDP